jgi:hypothetical protein
MKTPGHHQRRLTRSGATEFVKQLKPFASADIKICTFALCSVKLMTPVLLENVAQTGVEILQNQGYQVFHASQPTVLIVRLNSIRHLSLKIN